MPRIRLNRCVATFVSFSLTFLAISLRAAASETTRPAISDLAPPSSAEGPSGPGRSWEMVTAGPASKALPSDVQPSPEMLKELLRPNFNFAAEWQAETNDVGIEVYDAGVSLPVYPLFGPPPPFINARFTYSDLEAPFDADLPPDLYETEIGLAWLRLLNDQWMMHLMAGASFATDGNNDSSDAWRFRGGAFGLYRHNEAWTWVFGAIALGRNDLPVVPAVGVVYQPDPTIRLDLIMPRPRLSFLLADHGPRQQWGYVGMTLSGTTWGVERTDATRDQLTYGDWRAVLGWESTPRQLPGIPFTRGKKVGVELGYVFSREFEWDNDGSRLRLDDTLMLRGSVSF